MLGGLFRLLVLVYFEFGFEVAGIIKRGRFRVRCYFDICVCFLGIECDFGFVL